MHHLSSNTCQAPIQKSKFNVLHLRLFPNYFCLFTNPTSNNLQLHTSILDFICSSLCPILTKLKIANFTHYLCKINAWMFTSCFTSCMYKHMFNPKRNINCSSTPPLQSCLLKFEMKINKNKKKKKWRIVKTNTWSNLNFFSSFQNFPFWAYIKTINTITFWCMIIPLCSRPVYTTVEKSTGHEKNGVSQLWLVKNATLDWWVFTLREENNGGELFSWMIKWHGGLHGGTFWSWASPEEDFLAQLNKKYFIAFNSSPAHPSFASYRRFIAGSTHVSRIIN